MEEQKAHRSGSFQPLELSHFYCTVSPWLLQRAPICIANGQLLLRTTQVEKKEVKPHNATNKHCKRQNASNIKGIKLLLSARRTQEPFPDVAGLSPSLINSASNSLSEGCWLFRGPSPPPLFHPRLPGRAGSSAGVNQQTLLHTPKNNPCSARRRENMSCLGPLQAAGPFLQASNLAFPGQILNITVPAAWKWALLH